VREIGHIQSPDRGRRFAARLHEVTDGNPFHVIELLKTLVAQGRIAVHPESGEWMAGAGEDAEGRSALPLPATVREAIAERVAQLPYQHRDLLATIALSGSGCHTALLSHAHGISRLQAAALCDALVDKQLLSEEDGVYRAAHPVLANVVRESLTASRRKEVHRAIALSLEASTPDAGTPEVAGEIARHAERGGEWAVAYHYAMVACEEAVRRLAFDEALTWLDLAAGAAEGADQADAVNRRTADILSLAGWTEAPRRQRRSSSAMRTLAVQDLDLG
jgi:predicted ATPase